MFQEFALDTMGIWQTNKNNNHILQKISWDLC